MTTSYGATAICLFSGQADALAALFSYILTNDTAEIQPVYLIGSGIRTDVSKQAALLCYKIAKKLTAADTPTRGGGHKRFVHRTFDKAFNRRAPPIGHIYGGSYRSKNLHSENLGICSLASVLMRDNFNVCIVDARLENLSYHDIEAKMEGNNYLMIGLSLMDSASHDSAVGLARHLKRKWPKAHITVGGYYPTFHWRELLANGTSIDSVIPGEGEIAISTLAVSLLRREHPDGCYITRESAMKLPSSAQPRSLSMSPRDWPFPCHYANRVSNQQLAIESSRGCYGLCSFCAVSAFFNHSSMPGWKGKRPSDVVDDIKGLIELHQDKCREFQFIDANFIGPAPEGPEHAEEIAHKIIKSKLRIHFRIECRVTDVNRRLFRLLKKAGLVQVFLGIESGCQRILDDVNKGFNPLKAIAAVGTLREIGINFNYGFFMCDPNVTLRELKQNVEFLAEIGNVSPKHLFHHLMPTKGTTFYESLELHGKLITEDNGEMCYEPEHVAGKFFLNLQRYLESKRQAEMERIWKCYRGIQRGLDLGDSVIAPLERELSTLLLEAFHEIVCVVQYGKPAIVREVAALGDMFLSRVIGRISTIEQRCPPKYRIFG